MVYFFLANVTGNTFPWSFFFIDGDRNLRKHICSPWLNPSSLTHTTLTSILVLKFTNKGVFFEEIQDSHFPRKRGYFGNHVCEFGEKGLILMSSVLPWKGGFIWATKLVFYSKKGGSFWTEKSVFYHEKELFWAEKSVFCHKKGSYCQTGEQGWIPLFPVSEGARGIMGTGTYFIVIPYLTLTFYNEWMDSSQSVTYICKPATLQIGQIHFAS